jgi:hypothetical protein
MLAAQTARPGVRGLFPALTWSVIEPALTWSVIQADLAVIQFEIMGGRRTA